MSEKPKQDYCPKQSGYHMEKEKPEKLQYFLFIPRLGKDGKQVTMNPAYDEWVLCGDVPCHATDLHSRNREFPILDLVILDEDPREIIENLTQEGKETIRINNNNMDVLTSELTRLRKELEVEKEIGKQVAIDHHGEINRLQEENDNIRSALDKEILGEVHTQRVIKKFTKRLDEVEKKSEKELEKLKRALEPIIRVPEEVDLSKDSVTIASQLIVAIKTSIAIMEGK